MSSPNVSPVLTAAQREWLQVRAYLQEHRQELSVVAAGLYPEAVKIAGTHLLSVPSWLPVEPAPLATIELEWQPTAGPSTTLGAQTEHLRPKRPDGSRYESYSAAMLDLSAPQTFLNRSTYRLTHADLGGDTPRLTFEPGRYFDNINIGEAAAHELAAAQMGLIDQTPLRDSIGSPCDTARRPTNLAISTLTLRQDETTGEVSFPLHRRDPNKVGHAGGTLMVIPSGVFQAAGEEPRHLKNDFSLWRSMLREFSEELLGEPEDYGRPIDYNSWSFAAQMTEALIGGQIRAETYGIGVDPLTLATDLLTVVTIPSSLYDEIFSAAFDVNDEGQLAKSSCAPDGRWTMTKKCFAQLQLERMQAAGSALIHLAWQH